MKTKSFMNYLNRILDAETADERLAVFGEADMEYQRDNLTWTQLETLLKLVNKISR